MILLSVDVFAVLAATLLAVALGIIWYSPMVCGVIWMRSLSISESDIEQGFMQRGWRFVAGCAVYAAMFTGIATLIPSLKEGGSVGAFVGTASFIIILGTVQSRIWEGRNTAWALVNAGYLLISLWIGMGVLVYWPW